MAELTYRPNGNAITNLMARKGFSTAYDLSKAIDEAISERNIQIMIRGDKRHKQSTFEILAQFFDVPYTDLVTTEIDLPQPANAADSSPLMTVDITYFDIRVKLSIPLDRFEAIKAKWLADFIEDIRAKHAVHYKRAEAGSTIIFLEMTEYDIDNMITAFRTFQFRNSDIASIILAGKWASAAYLEIIERSSYGSIFINLPSGRISIDDRTRAYRFRDFRRFLDGFEMALDLNKLGDFDTPEFRPEGHEGKRATH
jgi:hypothetical protein